MQRQKTNIQLSSFLKSGSLLSILVIACTAIWLLMLLFPLVDYLYNRPTGSARAGWMEWLALSSEWDNLIRRPWSIFTYMFLHDGFFHLLFNMLMLFFGGTMCCRYLGQRRFGWIYFISGLSGALFYLLIYNLFPISKTTVSSLVGASAAVLGVFVSVGVYVPNQEVGIWPFRNVNFKLKHIVIALIVIDLISIPASNSGGHIAHIGGALAGWLYVVVMRANVGKLLKSKPFQKKNHKSTSSRPISDDEYNRRRAANQKRIDEILDKISKSGYESLSKEEKETLFNYK